MNPLGKIRLLFITSIVHVCFLQSIHAAKIHEQIQNDFQEIFSSLIQPHEDNYDYNEKYIKSKIPDLFESIEKVLEPLYTGWGNFIETKKADSNEIAENEIVIDLLHTLYIHLHNLYKKYFLTFKPLESVYLSMDFSKLIDQKYFINTQRKLDLKNINCILLLGLAAIFEVKNTVNEFFQEGSYYNLAVDKEDFENYFDFALHNITIDTEGFLGHNEELHSFHTHYCNKQNGNVKSGLIFSKVEHWKEQDDEKPVLLNPGLLAAAVLGTGGVLYSTLGSERSSRPKQGKRGWLKKCVPVVGAAVGLGALALYLHV